MDPTNYFLVLLAFRTLDSRFSKEVSAILALLYVGGFLFWAYFIQNFILNNVLQSVWVQLLPPTQKLPKTFEKSVQNMKISIFCVGVFQFFLWALFKDVFFDAYSSDVKVLNFGPPGTEKSPDQGDSRAQAYL